MRLKCETYFNKNFSQDFKKFTIESCLNSEPEKRRNALQLLNHPFIRKYEELDKTNVFIESMSRNNIPDHLKRYI